MLWRLRKNAHPMYAASAKKCSSHDVCRCLQREVLIPCIYVPSAKQFWFHVCATSKMAPPHVVWHKVIGSSSDEGVHRPKRLAHKPNTICMGPQTHHDKIATSPYHPQRSANHHHVLFANGGCKTVNTKRHRPTSLHAHAESMVPQTQPPRGPQASHSAII